MGPKLGVNGSNYIILLKPLKGDTIKLEDKELKVMGLDSKYPERSYVYVPSIKAVFGGINVFDKMHWWMADSKTKDARVSWLEVLNTMSKLDIKTVVSTHAGKETTSNKESIEFTKQYLITYEKAVSKSKNSKELISIMQKAYPNLNNKSFILSLGAKVTKGEMKW